MQPTFRPSRLRRARRLGFRAKMRSKSGQKVIRARRARGRQRLTTVK